MKKYLFFISCFLTACLSNIAATYAADHAPAFTGGATQHLTLCENVAAVPIDTLLSIIDSDMGQMETWSVVTNAAHGVLTAHDTATSTGSVLYPSGLFYTPTSGFSGMDSFIIQISDGFDSVTTTVYITILPLPSAGVITGASHLCAGRTIVLTDTAAGGTWRAANAHASVSSTGSVTGITRGADSLIYTVTNSCGTSADTVIISVNTVPRVAAITGIDSVCSGSSDTLRDAVSGGVWHSSSFIIAAISGAGIVTGILPGTSTITYIVSNDCGSDTARKTLKVQIPLIPGSIIMPDTVCQFTPTILIDISTGGTWSSSNFLVAAVLGPALIGISAGTATITYTLQNACGIATTTHSVTVLSTAECAAGVDLLSNNQVPSIHIFPNPGKGTFTFNCASPTEENLRFTITDINGRKVKELTGVTNKDIPVQLDQPAGIYFLRASSQSGSYTSKILVQ